MSEKEELIGSMKAVEATLASLVPRTDRLDRDRLIFLAGRESAVAESVPRAHWVWPGALAAMTTAAAVLLVMLLYQPEPPVVVKYVEIPVQRPDPDETVSENGSPPTEPDQVVSPPPQEPEEKPLHSGGRPNLLASLGLSWWPEPQGRLPANRVSYPRLLDQILTEGLDSLPPPESVAAPAESATPQLPYRELLDQMLKDQAHTVPGANSDGERSVENGDWLRATVGARPTKELRRLGACPHFPRDPAMAARKRGQAPSAIRITAAIPIVDGASPHFRAPAPTASGGDS